MRLRDEEKAYGGGSGEEGERERQEAIEEANERGGEEKKVEA